MPDIIPGLALPPVPAQIRRAPATGRSLRPIAGGRAAATRQRAEQRRARSAARAHSPQELGLLALCAGCVALIAGLLTFSILRDKAYLDRTTPVVAPLNR